MKNYNMNALPTVRRLGRILEKKDSAQIFWTGSGITFDFMCENLSITFRTGYKLYEYLISVTIDGELIYRIPLVPTRQDEDETDFTLTIPMIRNFSKDQRHNIRIMNDVQPVEDDKVRFLEISSIETDGEILSPSDYSYMLEFVGDSITSGEGAIGAKREADWLPCWMSSVNNFAYLTAKGLNAEYRIISQSGWGVHSAWDGNKNNVLSRIYERTSFPNDEAERYDFTSSHADAIIINLATNDDGAGNSSEDIIEDGIKLLKLIRKNNPDSEIVWAYGMLGLGQDNRIKKALEEMIRDFCEETGDLKLHFLALPNTTDKTVGAREHPGLENHREAAEVLINYLKGILTKKL